MRRLPLLRPRARIGSPALTRGALALLLVSPVLLLPACAGDETAALPKPRAYPRIEFPSGEPVAFALETCPFTFELPSYVRVERDTSFFDTRPAHPCWFDLVTPQLNGRVHFSYYPIRSLAEFERHRNDAFELAGKHNQVASYIDERAIERPEARVSGYAFDLEGDVASPFQFYVSDSTHHFLRGALYVDARAQADSLAPVYSFLEDDLVGVIGTLRWE